MCCSTADTQFMVMTEHDIVQLIEEQQNQKPFKAKWARLPFRKVRENYKSFQNWVKLNRLLTTFLMIRRKMAVEMIHLPLDQWSAVVHRKLNLPKYGHPKLSQSWGFWSDKGRSESKTEDFEIERHTLLPRIIVINWFWNKKISWTRMSCVTAVC